MFPGMRGSRAKTSRGTTWQRSAPAPRVLPPSILRVANRIRRIVRRSSMLDRARSLLRRTSRPRRIVLPPVTALPLRSPSRVSARRPRVSTRAKWEPQILGEPQILEEPRIVEEAQTRGEQLKTQRPPIAPSRAWMDARRRAGGRPSLRSATRRGKLRRSPQVLQVMGLRVTTS